MKIAIALVLLLLAGMQISFIHERWKVGKLPESEEKQDYLKRIGKFSLATQIAALGAVALYVIWTLLSRSVS